MADALEVYRATALQGVVHGFLGRQGGVSLGVVAGLNVGLGAGDDDRAVQRNRALAVKAVSPGSRLATVYQVHSADCVLASAPWSDAERPRADALVTATPGVLLGVVTADCAPVLLADRAAGVVGAAHAGWKGAVGGVTDATIAAMEALGADRARIVAAIGPCIAQVSYEVDQGFFDRFCADAPDNARFFAAGRTGHWQFDLERYVAGRLEMAGVTAVEQLGLDTYTDKARFFSYRRSTHCGEATYGRQISLIGL
ncbi:peptidoglycan editing factor PgeF [Novosphingobium sp.]|uniref:peptidoglycan editing factor PgeF n=1 Tax=Novosphingobium sp. TaxID=1874826 RepID=UPI0025F35D9C|nr:peptidoglycan editing factor PgeF [Novosphingobium sp.]